MYMHMLDKESRYLHNCSYEELLERPLTMKIFSIICEIGEATTTQIQRELKKMGFDIHRSTLLTYLNTMAKHNILTKKIRKSNIAYWDIGYNSIDLAELLRSEDIYFLKKFYAKEDIFFTLNGFHMYGFNRLLVYINEIMGLYEDEFNKIDSILKDIRKNFEKLIEIRNEIIEKEIERSMKVMEERWQCNEVDKIVFRTLFWLLTNHWDNNTLPEWIKKRNGDYIITCDINLAKDLQEEILPDLEIEEIVEMLNGYKIKKDMYEFIDFQAQLYQYKIIPFMLLIYEEDFHKKLLDKKLKNIKNKILS